MTKSELIKKLSEDQNLAPSIAQNLVDNLFDIIATDLQSGDRVEIRGFGVFAMKESRPRLGRNPKTGETVAVGARRSVTFHAGKQLQELLNKAK